MLLVSGKETMGHGRLRKRSLFSQKGAHCRQRSMLTSNGWALKKCSLDCKTVGYDLEGTSLKGNRLINMILLMTLAYLEAIFQGTALRKKQVQKYIGRRKEPKKRYRRRSTFGAGLDGEKWVNYLEQFY